MIGVAIYLYWITSVNINMVLGSIANFWICHQFEQQNNR